MYSILVKGSSKISKEITRKKMRNVEQSVEP